MDSYHASILAVLASVVVVGGVLLSSQDRSINGAVEVNVNDYGPSSNPHFNRPIVRTAFNINCPGEFHLEYCSTQGCTCAPAKVNPGKEGILYG